MKKTGVALLSAALIAASLPLTVLASGRGTPTTISNVVWTASWVLPTTSPFAACTQLRIDTTGDLSNSNMLSVYGYFNCSATPNSVARTYGTFGSAYFSPDGQFNMSLVFGNGTTVQCLRWGGLSGTCTVSDVAGSVTGTVQLVLN